VLDGNIRYMRVTGFPWVPGATAGAIDDAARFLGDGDAVIVDLRHNGGGSAQSVERIVSYFLPAKQRTLMTFVNAATNERKIGKTSTDLRAPRMVDKLLMVLIDGDTGSAAEEFAYQVQNFKLGILVGATTAGAANNDTLAPIAPDLVFSISTGRPIHPATNTNWEGVGVRPDVKTDSADALDEAQLRVLKLLEAKNPKGRSRYVWWEQAIAARLRPFAVDPAHLAAYAGTYGIRSVTVKGGELVYQRQGREPTILIPLGPDFFSFANTGDSRLRFRRAGNQVIGFDQITIDGATLPSARTG
jgi:hypothetical protein